MSHASSLQVACPSSVSWLSTVRFVKRPLLMLSLSLGMLLATFPMSSTVTLASETEIPVSDLADGTYVFGESSTAGQMGSTYMVLQVDAQQLVGGFYQPSSSFDCFQGQIRNDEMALNIVNSYDQTIYPFTLALDSSAQVASATGAAETIVPQGFQQLPELSATDRSVLATCQSQI